MLTISIVICYSEYERRTSTFNSLVFPTNSAVDIGFAGISGTLSDVSMVMSVTVCDVGEGE